MIMIDDLPNEVKLRIVAELDDQTARALLLVSKGWTAIAESRIWANVLLAPSIGLFHDTAPSDSGSEWADHLRRVLSQAPLPDPVVIFARQIAAFDAKWDRLLDSLKHDPRRATYLQALQLSPAINNHKAMLEVFKRIRPAVRSIVAQVYFESYSHEITPYHSHPAIIMGQVGSFQSLQKVVIEIPEDPDWLSKMWIMLASTPQLVSLESTGPDYVGDDIGEDHPPGYAETPSMDLVDALEVNLPKLELLKLEGVQAINLAVNVFRVAPNVSQLDIRLESHTIARLTAEDLDVFALKDSVTNVFFGGGKDDGEAGNIPARRGSETAVAELDNV